MEKAWAKLNGSYANTEGGHAYWAQHQLTGCPSQTVENDEVDHKQMWNYIKRTNQRNGTIVTNAKVGADKGIIGAHAYSLISAHEFSHNGKEIKLVKLRNPWGDSEWTGDWSDDSPVWTDELRKLVGCEKANDGVFFISIKDFVKTYESTHFCANGNESMMDQHKLFVDFNLQWHPMAFFSFKVAVNTTLAPNLFIAISTHQQGDRNYWGLEHIPEDDRYHPAVVNIMIFNSTGQLLAAKMCQQKNGTLLINQDNFPLPKGDYLIVIDPIFADKGHKDNRYKQMVVKLFFPSGKCTSGLRQLDWAKGLEKLAKNLKSLAQTSGTEKNYIC